MNYTIPTKSNWWGFIGKRVLISFVILLIVSLLIFFIVNVNSAGSFFSVYRGDVNGKEQVDRIIHYMGWDQPLVVRYFKWLGGVITGDWGRSIIKGIPVKDLIF